MAKTKRKKQQKKEALSKQQRSAPPSQEQQQGRFSWIPLWGWVLIFLVPLVISELMFYRAGRGVSMILFPLAWIGFWVAMMQRSGWSILRKRKED
jgi:hypothetical protein